MQRPRTFQRAMDTVLAGLKWRTCLIYIDDIFVFSASFDAHLKHLDAVLRRLRRHNLKLSPKKCSFTFTELKYLGYIISPDGLRVDPKKIDSVQKVAIPTTKGDLRSFVGLTSYYRRFIYKFAQLIEPLTRLLRDIPFILGADQQDAFERLKKRLTSAPLLIYPDWDKMFFLQTDASDYAIAAVLTQLDDDGYERVVSYASRQLRDPERRYDTREKELLAVVYGCKEFRKYLWGPPFEPSRTMGIAPARIRFHDQTSTRTREPECRSTFTSANSRCDRRRPRTVKNSVARRDARSSTPRSAPCFRLPVSRTTNSARRHTTRG